MAIGVQPAKENESKAIGSVKMFLGNCIVDGNSEMKIPAGVVAHVPVEKYRSLHGVARIEETVFLEILKNARQIDLPTRTRLEVGYEDRETLVFVNDPELARMLNMFAGNHDNKIVFALGEQSDGFSLLVEDGYLYEPQLAVSDVRFMDMDA